MRSIPAHRARAENLTAGQGAGEFELCAAVAAIVDDERKAARREASSPWQAFIGCRSAAASGCFRPAGPRAPLTITLHYGSGPSTL